MQMQPTIQPMQIVPLSQPQAGQPANDSHKIVQDLLTQLQQILKPTDQSDPLAPVGVTPAVGKVSDVKVEGSSKGKKSGGLMTSLEELLSDGQDQADEDVEKAGAASKSKDKNGGLAGLLTGKTSFGDTKAGKAISTIEHIGKLLALL